MTVSKETFYALKTRGGKWVDLIPDGNTGMYVAGDAPKLFRLTHEMSLATIEANCLDAMADICEECIVVKVTLTPGITTIEDI